MVVFVIVYSIGAYTDISKDEAEILRKKFNIQDMKNIDRNGIFVNNLRISLVMFISSFGIGFGIFTGFYTGFISHAIAETSNLSGTSTLLNLSHWDF